MLNFKYRTLWLAMGWLLVSLVVYISLVPQPPAALEFDYGDKLGHLLAYGMLMIWFCQIYWKPGSRILIALALVAMGVGMEFLQGLSGYRYFEYGDMLANGLGVLFGWLAALTSAGRLLVKIDQWINLALARK